MLNIVASMISCITVLAIYASEINKFFIRILSIILKFCHCVKCTLKILFNSRVLKIWSNRYHCSFDS